MTDHRPLMHKFDVRRVDGRDAPGEKHEGCALFVLDIRHDPAARAALAAYAEACHVVRPNLAADLRSLLYDLDVHGQRTAPTPTEET